MSMRDYAVDDYGLIMTRDMLKTICSKYCPDYTKKNMIMMNVASIMTCMKREL